MHWWQRLILIILMAVTSVLIAIPANSLMRTDYGQPTKARWQEREQEEEKEKKETEENEQEEKDERTAVIKFAEWESLAGPLWLLILLTLLLGIAYIVITEHWCKKHGSDSDYWLIPPVILQAVLLSGSIVVVISNSYYFDVPDRIAAIIEDEKLAEKAIEAYRSRQLLIPFVTFACFFVSDIIILFSACGVWDGSSKLSRAYSAYQTNLAESLQGGRHTLTIRSDGTVEQAKYIYRFRWLPFPAVVPERTITGRLPWPEVCKLLTQAVSASSMETLCRQFKISLSSLFDAVGTKTSSSIVTAISDKVHHKMNGQLTRAVARDDQAVFSQAEELLQSTSDKTLKRFQQDLVNNVSKTVGSHLNDFRQLAIQFMQAKAAGDAIYVPQDGSAFPPGTKFCLAKGKTTVFVVEEQPQTRTMMFSRGFWKDSNQSLDQDTSFQLAFPYVIFVVELVNGHFVNMFVFYSKRPITSLNDSLCWPNLPNIYSTGRVCLNLNLRQSAAATSAETVGAAISHFWQSMFNNDLREYQYDASNPVRDVWRWKRKSKTDPSFVLTADWRERDEPIEELIKELFKGEKKDEMATAERRVRQSLSKAIDSLTSVVHTACSEISVKRRHTKAVAKELAGNLQSLSKSVLGCMVAQLNDAVADTNGNVRHQYDYHLQREVNKAVAETFFREAAAALLEHHRLPDSVYQALEEGRE